jgi:hypothetical protein
MPICDLEFIKGITPGSNVFPIKVIELFLNETPARIQDLKIAISNSNWEETYSIAHKIKPGVLMLGIPHDASDALLSMLRYTKEEKHLDEIKDLFKVFTKDLDAIYLDLATALKNMKKDL